jgi:ABC-type sugar transport system permease subunit
MDIGFGSAVGVVLFVLCVGFTAAFRRVLTRRE